MASSGPAMAPVSMGQMRLSSAPVVNGRSGHSITVSHREFISDISCNAEFTVQLTRSLNPGLDVTFPWLAAVARKYESYIFRQLVFSYEPVCASSTAGVIYMAVDYDATDSTPQTKADLTSYVGCTKAQAWMPFKYFADPRDLAKFSKDHFTRGVSYKGDDLKTYDVGKLFVGASGGNGQISGELYVEYTVELITPQNDVDYLYENSGKIVAGGVISRLSPFGTAPVKSGGLPVGVDVDGDLLTFDQVGEYLLEYALNGTVFTGNPPTTGGTTAANSTVDYTINPAVNGATYVERVKVSAPGQTMTYNFTNSCTTLTGLVLRVMPYLYSM